jgi:hypothetical protein
MSISDLDKAAIRSRTLHFLSYETAVSAGLRLEDLQQIVAGTFQPTDLQWRRLANHMRYPLAATTP